MEHQCTTQQTLQNFLEYLFQSKQFTSRTEWQLFVVMILKSLDLHSDAKPNEQHRKSTKKFPMMSDYWTYILVDEIFKLMRDDYSLFLCSFLHFDPTQDQTCIYFCFYFRSISWHLKNKENEKMSVSSVYIILQYFIHVLINRTLPSL